MQISSTQKHTENPFLPDSWWGTEAPGDRITNYQHAQARTTSVYEFTQSAPGKPWEQQLVRTVVKTDFSFLALGSYNIPQCIVSG